MYGCTDEVEPWYVENYINEAIETGYLAGEQVLRAFHVTMVRAQRSLRLHWVYCQLQDYRNTSHATTYDWVYAGGRSMNSTGLGGSKRIPESEYCLRTALVPPPTTGTLVFADRGLSTFPARRLESSFSFFASDGDGWFGWCWASAPGTESVMFSETFTTRE